MGEGKFSVVEMPRNNIRCTWVSFTLPGSVFIVIKGGSRVNKGDCVINLGFQTYGLVIVINNKAYV